VGVTIQDHTAPQTLRCILL